MSAEDSSVQNSFVNLTADEILPATRSIFADGLKPYGRVLLKRLRERAAERAAEEQGLALDAVDPETMPRIDPRRLRTICKACTQLNLEPEDGREYSVSIRGEEHSYIDVTSVDDNYPQELWEGLAAFADTMEEDAHLPGGRYACAKGLMRLDFDFLSELSLGQVCHVVQLATTKKKIFGYMGNNLVPYKFSSDYVKAECAMAQCPTGKEVLPAATWEQASSCLRVLVETPLPNEPSGITISNVKRLFRSFFGLELSETSLGHVRLYDLLHDPRFTDCFEISEQKSGQLMMAPVLKAELKTEPEEPPLAAPPGVWNTNANVYLNDPCAHPAAPGIWNTNQFALTSQDYASSFNWDSNFGYSPVFPSVPSLTLPVRCDSSGSEALLSPGASPRGSARGSSFAADDNSKGASSPGSTTAEDWSSQISFGGVDTEEEHSRTGATRERSWTVQVKNTFIALTPAANGSQSARRARSVSQCRTPLS